MYQCLGRTCNVSTFLPRRIFYTEDEVRRILLPQVDTYLSRRISYALKMETVGSSETFYPEIGG
jgi:hypothetical protein